MKLQRYRTGATTYEIPGLPYCDEPVRINREEPRSASGYVGLSLTMWGPCRKCEKCLLFKSLKWAERIEAEILKAPRTWFLTLTFSPIHLAGIIAESFRLPHIERQAAIERAAYKHVELYFKRLRKSGARFRYCAVPEYGEDHGRLHYHVALHETLEGSAPKRLLDGNWRSFTHARLVRAGTQQRAAKYISKYLTKTLSRPRASTGYGK